MIARVLVLLCVAVFLARTFPKAWNIDESDFPNYYTGAVLVRHSEPLRKYYEWPWFQRQINFAGLEKPLGTYIPQTPLTMLPLVPVAGFPAQAAKRAWLVLNLAFLAATVWLLSRVTRVRIEHVALLLFAGYEPLRSNFLLGQYYVFLLFLLALTVYCLPRLPTTAGALCGLVFALKLYGAPFILYFAAKRNWRALAGMIGTICAGGVVAVVMFGWHDVGYFLTDILPRAVDGEGIGNPYHPAGSTLMALLRRVFFFEPELNPHPLWNAPEVFFFLRPLLVGAILLFAAVGLANKHREPSETRGFAWFMLATLCVAPNLGTYAFILFFLPILLLTTDATANARIALAAAYIVLAFPVPAALMWAFPKVWIFVGLFLVVGREYWRGLRPGVVLGTVAFVVFAAAVDARRHMVSLRQEPESRFAQIALGQGPRTVFTSSLAVSRAGIFCEAIIDTRYGLVWLHDNQSEALTFDGEAFHPTAPAPNGPIFFELVSHATSRMMEFDPATRQLVPTEYAPGPPSSVSPDGKWQIMEITRRRSHQIWLRNTTTGRTELLAGGQCSNTSPIWELDSKALLFASDCQRGIGLGALYRARVHPQ
jgi:hypothetical protein